MNKIEASFEVTSIGNAGSAKVLHAVPTAKDNQGWSAGVPTGELRLGLDNPDVHGIFEGGDSIRVTIEKISRQPRNNTTSAVLAGQVDISGATPGPTQNDSDASSASGTNILTTNPNAGNSFQTPADGNSTTTATQAPSAQLTTTGQADTTGTTTAAQG